MTSRRLDYCKQTSIAAYERALQSLRVTVNLDAAIRELTRDPHGETVIRDAAMAQTVEWILDRHDRIVVAAHNGHVQRCPVSVAGVPAFTPMGMHMADRLGDDYRVIGTTCGTGRTPATEIGAGKLFTELEAPQTGSLDAVMAASHRGPFAVDLQRVSPADATTIRTVSQQRLANLYCDTSPLQAFDIVIHVPRVSLADPDLSAFAQHPRTYGSPPPGNAGPITGATDGAVHDRAPPDGTADTQRAERVSRKRRIRCRFSNSNVVFTAL